MAVKQRFQASVLTWLSLLESRSAAGTSEMPWPVGGTHSALAGVGDAAGLGQSLDIAPPRPGMAGELGSSHLVGSVWPWGPWSAQVIPVPSVASLPSTSQAGLSSALGHGLVQQPGGPMQAHSVIGYPVQWGPVYAVASLLSVGDISLPLGEHLLPGTKEKIIRGSLWISSRSDIGSWRRRTNRIWTEKRRKLSSAGRWIETGPIGSQGFWYMRVLSQGFNLGGWCPSCNILTPF